MPNNNKGEKGFSLEYMVTGLFQSQGYLARRSIPLQYGPVNQDATDVDVLGIQFTLPFKGHRVICDCKNKQRSKPYERIFWAKGLGEFVKASEVYVALPKTSPEIIKFAQTGGVRILTGDKVGQFFNTPSGKYGVADEKFYKNIFNTIEMTIKKDKQAEKLWLSTKKLFLREDPYVSINIVFNNLDTATKQISLTQHHESNMFWKYLCCELVVLIGLQILWICADTYSLPEKAREERILSKLTYGELEPSQAHNLLTSAKDLANEIIKANVPLSYLPNTRLVDFGQFPPPQYAYNVVGLVERALQNPQWYVDMPQLLDFLLFEQGLKGKDFSDNAYRDMFRSELSEEKLKSARNILSFVKDSVGFEWKMIWTKRVDSYKPSSARQVTKDVNIKSTEGINSISNRKKRENQDKMDEQPFNQLNVGNILEQVNRERNEKESNPIMDHIIATRNTVKTNPSLFFSSDFLAEFTSYKDLNDLLNQNGFASFEELDKINLNDKNRFTRRISNFKKWDELLEAALDFVIQKKLSDKI